MKLFILLLVFLPLFAFGQKTAEKNILFVCEHGAARSVIAAAYFNRLAKEQGLNYKAIFRGTDPDSLLTAGTIKGLTQDGFKVDDWKPLLISKKDADESERIVTLDCELPSISAHEKWTGIPPISQDYNLARNEIVKKVKKLIKQLKKK